MVTTDVEPPNPAGTILPSEGATQSSLTCSTIKGTIPYYRNFGKPIKSFENKNAVNRKNITRAGLVLIDTPSYIVDLILIRVLILFYII